MLISLICFFMLAAPVALTTVALIGQGTCFDFAVDQWLFGYGVASLVSSMVICVTMYFVLMFVHATKNWLIALTLLNTMLGLAWLFVGGLVLFSLCASVLNVTQCFPVYLVVLNTLQGLVWFIVGGAALVFDAKGTTDQGIAYICYGAAMWCASAFFIIVVY